MTFVSRQFEAELLSMYPIDSGGMSHHHHAHHRMMFDSTPQPLMPQPSDRLNPHAHYNQPSPGYSPHSSTIHYPTSDYSNHSAPSYMASMGCTSSRDSSQMKRDKDLVYGLVRRTGEDWVATKFDVLYFCFGIFITILMWELFNLKINFV